jgi:hypothetical protein
MGSISSRERRPIDRIPYRAEFDALRRRLSDVEFDAMVVRINELIFWQV